jgi:8-oxo-dGTP pyrophosphatase MutT (NUDIX family)
MYEVFYNHNRLAIAGVNEDSILNTSARIIRADNPEIMPEIVQNFLSGDPYNVVLMGDPEKIWKEFSGHFQSMPAAGGVVQSDAGVLFIFRRGRWDLPKGKIDPGETVAEAALREVTEETGLQNLEIVRYLTTTWHVYTLAGSSAEAPPVLKDTHWFLMRGSSSDKLVPETGEDIESARWITPGELPLVLPETYASLQGIVRTMMTGTEDLTAET